MLHDEEDVTLDTSNNKIPYNSRNNKKLVITKKLTVLEYVITVKKVVMSLVIRSASS